MPLALASAAICLPTSLAAAMLPVDLQRAAQVRRQGAGGGKTCAGRCRQSPAHRYAPGAAIHNQPRALGRAGDLLAACAAACAARQICFFFRLFMARSFVYLYESSDRSHY